MINSCKTVMNMHVGLGACAADLSWPGSSGYVLTVIVCNTKPYKTAVVELLGTRRVHQDTVPAENKHPLCHYVLWCNHLAGHDEPSPKMLLCLRTLFCNFWCLCLLKPCHPTGLSQAGNAAVLCHSVPDTSKQLSLLLVIAQPS